MRLFSPHSYTRDLTKHYENFFGVTGKHLSLKKGPTEKLHPDFFILEFSPNKKHSMFCYCTVGMSIDRLDDNLVELIIYASKADEALVELLTICASYHRNGAPLNLHHTVDFGQPWKSESNCDHGFISLPYLDGPELEIFSFAGNEIHCYWIIPITEKEKNYKSKYGWEALERLFEGNKFDYLNPDRDCVAP